MQGITVHDIFIKKYVNIYIVTTKYLFRINKTVNLSVNYTVNYYMIIYIYYIYDLSLTFSIIIIQVYNIR